MNIPTNCRYCGGSVILCDSSTVYRGKSYGNIYICVRCRAYVGANKKTGEPIGTLADAPLREKRKQARAAVEAWCRAEEIDRINTYKWLAEMLGLPVKETNIGLFEADACDQVIEIIRENMITEVA